ncbi:UNVERIFIED_CONTAM: hypothetical protein RMT77_001218 [Armadillidium vulgare]
MMNYNNYPKSMSNFGITAVEAVGLTIPDNLSNDPVTKAVYDNILGKLPTQKKDQFSCSLCKLNFSSKTILNAHLSGSKHEKKLKAQEILKSLARTDPTCGKDPSTGQLRCSICNVTVMAAHCLKKHSMSREHRLKKGEDVADDEEPPAEMNGVPTAIDPATGVPIKKKERPRVTISVPDCVTKTEDTRSGGKYFCNPCQAHCNSDIQLQQHLSCKKHLEKFHSNLTCTICDLKFTSKAVLISHLGGAKHDRKVKTKEILNTLARIDPTCGQDPDTGELRCSLCNVAMMTAQLLEKHVTSREHRINKGENVEDEDINVIDQNNLNGNGMPPKKKEKAEKKVPGLTIPDCVTKTEGISCGGKFFCNLCQVYCNSETQLSQHLNCKKHIAKASGRTLNPAPRLKGGVFSRGRGLMSPRDRGSYGRMDNSLSGSSSLLINSVGSNYNQNSYHDNNLSNYADSYGLSSLGRNSANDYRQGKSNSGPRGGGRVGNVVCGRNEGYNRSEGDFGRGNPAYVKPDTFPRTAEYPTDYHHGKANDYNTYSRSSAPYAAQGYGAGQSGGHAANRGVYTYTQPLAHNFVAGGKIL